MATRWIDSRADGTVPVMSDAADAEPAEESDYDTEGADLDGPDD